MDNSFGKDRLFNHDKDSRVDLGYGELIDSFVQARIGKRLLENLGKRRGEIKLSF